ncbi:MAG: hypothetical protein AAF609_11650 [Cyanobacteria bacterium P01_C01_bin.120]
MKKFESKQAQSFLNVREGWSVQVYSSDRRLLWVLEPSHCWTFLLGCGFGLLLSVIWFNVARYSSPIEPVPSSESSKLQID